MNRIYIELKMVSKPNWKLAPPIGIEAGRLLHLITKVKWLYTVIAAQLMTERSLFQTKKKINSWQKNIQGELSGKPLQGLQYGPLYRMAFVRIESFYCVLCKKSKWMDDKFWKQERAAQRQKLMPENIQRSAFFVKIRSFKG